MLLIQSSGDHSQSMAYEIGYSIGYFFGSNSYLIFLISGIILAAFVFFFLRRRRKRKSQPKI